MELIEMNTCRSCNNAKGPEHMIYTHKCRRCYNADRLIYSTRAYAENKDVLRVKMLERYYAKKAAAKAAMDAGELNDVLDE